MTIENEFNLPKIEIENNNLIEKVLNNQTEPLRSCEKRNNLSQEEEKEEEEALKLDTSNDSTFSSSANLLTHPLTSTLQIEQDNQEIVVDFFVSNDSPTNKEIKLIQTSQGKIKV